MTPPDVATPLGRAWLRSAILVYVHRHPWVDEDKILRHVGAAVGDDYEGTDPGWQAAHHTLSEMVEKDHALLWKDQRGKPDAPLLYKLTMTGRAELAATGGGG